MKDFVLYVARALAAHPEQIEVSEVDGEHTSVFEIRCHHEDLGRVIGKSGKTIGARRVLLNNVAARQGRRAMLEVVEQ